MFRFDAFGQRIICNPRLMFKDGGGGGGGGGDDAAAQAAAATKFLEDNGYPDKTKVEDMELSQQVAYWHSQSKKQQRLAEGKADPDELKAAQDELEKLRKGQLTEQEKAVEEARDQARREGEVIGSEKYLRVAVTAMFQLLTGKTEDEVATTFDVVDPKKFLDDKGEILADKLKAFAETFGTKGAGNGGGTGDPVRDALNRLNGGGGGNGGGSVSELKKARKEELKPSK